MQIFTWRACICGIIQCAFIYNHELFSWSFLFSPISIYLFLELILGLAFILTEEFISNLQATKSLIHLSTIGLSLASILLLSEALDSKLSIQPSILPMFLIFFMHSIYKVLSEPPLFLSPLLNLLTPPLAVCSMSGSCNSFYISIMSSFFGAFGSSIVDIFIVLKPMTYVLLFITVLSVYSSEKKIFNSPFIFSVFSALLIIFGEINENMIVIVIGNVFLVTAVIWNNKNLKKDEIKSV